MRLDERKQFNQCQRLSLRYCLIFLVLAAAFVSVAIADSGGMGWGVVLPLDAGLSFALLAAAYAGAGPRLLLRLRFSGEAHRDL